MNNSTYHHKSMHPSILDWRWIILMLIAFVLMLTLTIKAAGWFEPVMVSPIEIHTID